MRIRTVTSVLFVACACLPWAAYSQSNGAAAVLTETQSMTPPPKLALPQGPFGVGRIGYDWTDPARLDRYSNNRQFTAS